MRRQRECRHTSAHACAQSQTVDARATSGLESNASKFEFDRKFRRLGSFSFLTADHVYAHEFSTPYLAAKMSSLPPELAAVLQSINARLGAIEAAISTGGAAAAPSDANELSRLAKDFESAVANVSGKAATEAADKLGDEGKKLVCVSAYRHAM